MKTKYYVIMIGKATYHVSGLDIRTAENKAITQFKNDNPNIDTEKLIVNSFTDENVYTVGKPLNLNMEGK
jgi:hypothetical protein